MRSLRFSVAAEMSRLRSTTLQIGDHAPSFSLFAINEQLVHLPEVLDEVPILLLFVPGAWSPNTRRQLAELSACYDRLHVAGVGVMAVVTQDARSLRRRLATDMPPFPILSDENREAARTFGVFRALSWDGIGVTRPAAFLIDRAGLIRFAYVGERDADLPETEALIHLVGALFGVDVPDVVEESGSLVEEPPTDGGVLALAFADDDDFMTLVAVIDESEVTQDVDLVAAGEATLLDVDEVGTANGESPEGLLDPASVAPAELPLAPRLDSDEGALVESTSFVDAELAIDALEGAADSDLDPIAVEEADPGGLQRAHEELGVEDVAALGSAGQAPVAGPPASRGPA